MKKSSGFATTQFFNYQILTKIKPQVLLMFLLQSLLLNVVIHDERDSEIQGQIRYHFMEGGTQHGKSRY